MRPTLVAVLPVRNRSAERVFASGKSLLACSGDFDITLVVSDYGSDNGGEIKKVANILGATYIRQEASYWNKPHCLNVAISQSSSEFILCADIDIVWHPDAIRNALSIMRIEKSQRKVLAFQSRDLPSDMTEMILEDGEVRSWEELEASATIHSTWGNGILLFQRKVWQEIGGYDERLSVYGVEDMDFCRRAQLAGAKFIWSEPMKSRIYHVWHPRLDKVSLPGPFNRALERNRNVWRHDRSVVRNVSSWRGGEDPLVSVVIATAGRSEFLREAIASILCQSVQSFEVIVVDDGQLDATEAVVREFADSRIVYIGLSEPQGISAARNIGGARARGEFLAVMDDDDICLPDRFEVSLSAIAGGVDGCVGGFVTFYDESGEVLSWDDPLPTLEGAFAKGGFSGHPTWMIRRSVFNSFSYDESFTSAVDNNRALRMLTSGVRLVHTGRPHILRRVHEGQVSNRDQQFQGFGAVLDKTWLWSGYRRSEWQALVEKSTKSAPKNRATLYESVFIPYLPDSLVHREVDVIVWDEKSSDFVKTLEGYSLGVEVRHGKNFLYGKYRVGGSWMTMARLAQRGLKYSVSVLEPTEQLTHKKYVPTHPEFSASIPWRRIGKAERPVDVTVRTVENALGKERIVDEKSVKVSSSGANFSENAMAEFLVGEE